MTRIFLCLILAALSSGCLFLKAEAGQANAKSTGAKAAVTKKAKKKLAAKTVKAPVPFPKPAVPAKQENLPPEQPPLPDAPNAKASEPPLNAKTLVIDARRLNGNKFTETVRYILDHEEVRFKLQNVTINPDFIVPLLQDLKKANVLGRIKDLTFVITNEKNALLDEAGFMAKVLPLLGHIEGLELNCLGVTEKVVKAISLKMPALKSLSLFGLGINDAAIGYLAKSLPNLTKLHLINSSITLKGVQELIKKFKGLKAVGLSGQNLADQDFIILAKSLPYIQSFAVVGQTFKGIEKVKTLLALMPNLHSIDLSETNVTDEVIKTLVNTTKGLRNLDISETPLTRESIKDVAENLDLHSLKMNSLKNIGDADLKLIADRQINLKKLYFSGADYTNFGVMDIIQKLPGLLELTLLPAPESKWVLTDAVAAALVYNLKKLQYLHIQPGRLPEEIRLYLVKEKPLLHIEYQP